MTKEKPGIILNLNNVIKTHIPVLSWFPRYDRKWFRFDIIAGLTLAAFAIPDGMAYASLAGLPPQYGLYSALVAPLIFFIFTTSRQGIVGPSSSEAILLASVLAVVALGDPYRYIMLASMTAILVGIIALIAWAFRMGFLVNLISGSVLKGFLVGTGVVIIVGQIPKIMGIAGAPPDFIAKIVYILANIGYANVYSIAIGVGGIIVLYFLNKRYSKWPNTLILLIGAIVLMSVTSLATLGVQIVGTVPGGVPCFAVPDVSLQDTEAVFPLALALFLLSYVELTTITRMYAKNHRYDIDTNQELLALGASSVGTGFFQGFPIAGSFGKSAVNDRAGALSPLAGAIAGLVIILVVMFLTGFLYYIPAPILAALIIVAVITMVDFPGFLRIGSINRPEMYIALITFACVLIFGIPTGILIGVILSLIDILYNISFPHIAVQGRIPGTSLYGDIERRPGKEEIPGVIIVRIDAPLIFANANVFKETIRTLIEERTTQTRLVLIDLAPSPIIDTTAAEMIKDLYSELKRQNISLMILNASGRVRDILRAIGIDEITGVLKPNIAIDDVIREWITDQL
ncbi:MAG TPA: sulfate permease [Methanoregulaceae archaeon]|nr:sulfate permease [Methanoregulaceae archaeon]